MTSSPGQDSTANSQTSRDKINPEWEHVSKDRYANGRKALICLYYKKVAKDGGIHRIKQHFIRVKENISPCKSVSPDVRFQMKKSLKKFVNSNKTA